MSADEITIQPLDALSSADDTADTNPSTTQDNGDSLVSNDDTNEPANTTSTSSSTTSSTINVQSGSNQEETKSQERKEQASMPPAATVMMKGEEILELLDLSKYGPLRFEVGDHIMGRYQNQGWYPGTLHSRSDDGLWVIHYDDGDVEDSVPVERIMTQEQYEASGIKSGGKARLLSKMECADGSVVECSAGSQASFPLASLFDFTHGRPDSDKNEWRVRKPNNQKAVKITIRFAKPYFLSRIRIYGCSFNRKRAVSDYRLFVLPASTTVGLVTPVVVTDKVVNCSMDNAGDFHEHPINKLVSTIIIELPTASSANIQYVTLGGIDIFHMPKRRDELDALSNTSPKSTFFSDFNYLLNNKRFADCVLLVEDREIYAHKNVLAARSEFFRNMLEGPVQYAGADEKVQQIKIDDVPYKVMLCVLRYIYTDQVDLSSIDVAVDLWAVADRFQLLHLKYLIENHLDKDLSTEKAIEICKINSIELFTNLTERVVGFLARNFHKCMDSEALVHIPPSILHKVLVQVKNRTLIEELLDTHAEQPSNNDDTAA